MKLAAYDNTGRIVIYHNGNRYVYYGLSPIHRMYLEGFIKRGQAGYAFNFLRRFSRSDLIPDLKGLKC